MKHFAYFIAVVTLLLASCQDANVAESKRTQIGAQPSNPDTVTDQPSSENPGSSFSDLNDPNDPCGMTSAFNIAPQFSAYIVGGQAARSSDLVTKSTVKVLLNGGHCTGTLIGPNQILTAAHCFQLEPNSPTDLSVNFLSDPSDVAIGLGVQGSVAQNLRVESILPHPRYEGILGNPSTNRYADIVFYDVALITFSGTLPSSYRPVVIGDSSTEVRAGTSVYVSGYGAYSENDQTLRPLTSVTTTVDSVNQFREIQLSIDANDPKGACYGDSGGPTYVYSESLSCLKLVGSTTGPGRLSNYTCDQGSGTMMDVTSYRGWIKCSLEQMGAPLNYLRNDGSESDCSRNSIIQ